ncbi:hypothetical protein [Endozoicomonas numazuensis]|uniref:Uncharacterized protein n=1 Tax=Endozoicomonas numazuensis TaxID=1137799 RepID=A0A081NHX2_9GAMM|nr:hypothetical protein [Endozoicomonas numazuensis]KEQ18045.1 hypothetical protein GZ78_10700 [Endozoicomonas numazuensis]
MESIIILFICGLALYQLSLRQDKMAEQMVAQSFNRFERRYNNVTYSCLDATVVKKQLHGFPSVPLVPSVNYTARALCLSDNNHWFWFDASIRNMKLCSTSITPVSLAEASDALSCDPEALSQYFPKKKNTKAKAETST